MCLKRLIFVMNLFMDGFSNLAPVLKTRESEDSKNVSQISVAVQTAEIQLFESTSPKKKLKIFYDPIRLVFEFWRLIGANFKEKAEILTVSEISAKNRKTVFLT